MARIQDSFPHIDHFITRRVKEANLPGMAVAITDREKILHAVTCGFSDVGTRRPITQQTLFEIGSIGKSFTSIILLQEKAAGRLELDAPVIQYLPWFQVKSSYDAITVHHLMCHTAGIIRGTDVSPHGLYEVYALRNTKAACPPGRYFHYSDLAYKALGFLLEAVLDQPYHDILRSHILDPLGMTETHAVMTFPTRAKMATGYRYFYDDRPSHRDHPIVPAPWHEYGTADGSPASTAEDMVRYVRMLLNRGRGPGSELLSEEGFTLLTQRLARTAHGVFYGYGIVIEDIDGHLCLSHGGQTLGYSSVMLADMVDGIGVVILFNGPGGALAAYALAYPVLKFLRAALHNQSLPPLPPAVHPAVIANATEYAGIYRMGPHSLTFICDGDRLVLQHGSEPVSLEQRSPDRFYANHPDFALFLFEFQRNSSQEVMELFHGPNWYVREQPALPASDVPEKWKGYTGHYRSHNPWNSNFRIVLRKNTLVLIHPAGDTKVLVPVRKHSFRVGEDEHSPEFLHFDSLINGQAARANLSGCDYYRAFTP